MELSLFALLKTATQIILTWRALNYADFQVIITGQKYPVSKSTW